MIRRNVAMTHEAIISFYNPEAKAEVEQAIHDLYMADVVGIANDGTVYRSFR